MSDRDSDGRQISDGQREYFKDSVVRDDDGNLIPVYHSTHEEFYTFKRVKLGGETLVNANDASLAATSLVGHWFSDHDNSNRIGGHSLKCYLNITRPYRTDLECAVIFGLSFAIPLIHRHTRPLSNSMQDSGLEPISQNRVSPSSS